jgi:serine/threonine-protein kinase
MDPTNLTPVGDQYSLGCVLYYCLTGRFPFPEGTAVEKMMYHQTKQPTPIKELAPDAPDALVAVVERLMQKAPANRYPSCAEAIDALRPLSGPVNMPARRPTMTMPRVKVPAAPAPRAAAPAPMPAPAKAQQVAPRVNQPLPPRAPSAPAAAAPRPAPYANPAAPAPGAEHHPAPPAVERLRPTHDAGDPSEPQPLGQRLGTAGVILLAVAAGALAWLLSSLVNFKF